MKISFTKDHQSAASGNSFYKAGTEADLRGAKTLIDLGVAREGWGATGGHVTADAVRRMIDAPIVSAKSTAPDLSPTRKVTAERKARALAKEHDLLIYSVVGTGKNGKILLSDVEALIA